MANVKTEKTEVNAREMGHSRDALASGPKVAHKSKPLFLPAIHAKTHYLLSKSRPSNKSNLHFSISFGLLQASLEATMSKLGGCVNELKLELFHCTAGCLLVEGLPQGDNSLLKTHNKTF